MQEARLFPPPAEFAAKARIGSLAAYEALWNEAAADIESVLGQAGRRAALVQAVRQGARVERAVCQMVRRRADERLVQLPRRPSRRRRARNKAAIIWEGEPGDAANAHLSAAAPRSLQVRQRARRSWASSRATWCRSTCRWCRSWRSPCWPAPGSARCIRVIFGGFSSEAIADRNNDAKAKLVITADGGWRRGQQLPLKENVDEALAKSPTVRELHRLSAAAECKSTCKPAAIIWWHDLMAEASADCPAEPLDSETPLFILYTSGSTGKPKGIKHTTAGYNLFVKKTFEWVFDHRDEDIFWCTADCGWVTGHSYVVYGPLSAGATVLMYEGAPNWPDEGRFWDIIEKYRVTIFYTAPTAIRAFIKWGDQLGR